jgi:hypothetical protein
MLQYSVFRDIHMNLLQGRGKVLRLRSSNKLLIVWKTLYNQRARTRELMLASSAITLLWRTQRERENRVEENEELHEKYFKIPHENITNRITFRSEPNLLNFHGRYLNAVSLSAE